MLQIRRRPERSAKTAFEAEWTAASVRNPFDLKGISNKSNDESKSAIGSIYCFQRRNLTRWGRSRKVSEFDADRESNPSAL